MKKLSGSIIGIILIVCGVLYILNIFGIAEFEFSLNGWWTLFIILPCLDGILTSKDKVGNLTGILFGVLLLLAARGIFEYSVIWKIIVPIIIVMIGIKMIVKSLFPEKESEDIANGEKEHMALFSERIVDCSDEEITVAKIGAVFGGVKYNLANAKITEKNNIDILCLFGGAEIVVPEDVTIKINTFCLFGGISDKRAIKNENDGSVTLNINGFCIFGGADIK